MAGPSLLRVDRVAAVAATAVAVAVAVGSCASLRQVPNADYCAIMPDSVGLYAGNPVTQMGYQIGTVKRIIADTTDVRVEFTVTEGRRLPSDVKAITRSASMLADRSLELVGDSESGAELPAGACIPLSRSLTPKSLSELIGSATNLVNSINPDGSTNVADVVHELDRALHNKGARINHMLTTTSGVLSRPDRPVGDIGSIITNLAQLTSLATELRGPLKEILYDTRKTMPDLAHTAEGVAPAFGVILMLEILVSDLEIHLGDETQFTLDAVAMALRKLSAHAPRVANLLNPVPWWINSLANIANTHGLNFLRYRPPLYRVRTPDGVALCNLMNAKTPGSCANVQGTPYAVDVALLQYVLTEAAKR